MLATRSQVIRNARQVVHLARDNVLRATEWHFDNSSLFQTNKVIKNNLNREHGSRHIKFAHNGEVTFYLHSHFIS
jgi:hypothetical protein